MTNRAENIGLIVLGAVTLLGGGSMARYQMSEIREIYREHPEIQEIEKLETIARSSTYQYLVAQGNTQAYASIEGRLQELNPKRPEIRETREEIAYEEFWGKLGLIIAFAGITVSLGNLLGGYLHNARTRREENKALF